jgi:hypothetical protein
VQGLYTAGLLDAKLAEKLGRRKLPRFHAFQDGRMVPCDPGCNRF